MVEITNFDRISYSDELMEDCAEKLHVSGFTAGFNRTTKSTQLEFFELG